MSKAKNATGGYYYKRGRRWWWQGRIPGIGRVRRPCKGPRQSVAVTSKADAVRIVAGWLRDADQAQAAGLAAGPSDVRELRDIRVDDVAAAYKSHARAYYRDPETGKPNREAENLCRSADRLAGYPPCGLARADDFGPALLKQWRAWMVAQVRADGRRKWSRHYINRQVAQVRRMWRWAVSEELVPPDAAHGLAAVEPLKRGRTEARETPAVGPVDPAHVDRTVAELLPTVAAMVRFQQCTGARPGEVCRLRVCDIDRGRDVWIYRPPRHKTAHHGHERRIAVGPRGRAVLEGLAYWQDLLGSPWEYVFSPRRAVAEKRAAARAGRKTPESCGNRPGTNRKAAPQREPGERYDTAAYGRAVRRAIERANAKAGAAGLPKMPRWHLHQLRHAAATAIREEFGLEAARAALGHRSLAIADTYAELDAELAARVAREIG